MKPDRLTMEELKVIDLFAGIGGFHLGFEQAGAKVVFASEWDSHARKTYQANFADHNPTLFENHFAGDITKVNMEDIPPFNILTGGFPCQPFSGAGKKAGFEDTRGTLFFTIAEILKQKQPEAFFLENVRGLLTHDSGNTFNVIKNTIDEIGYTLHWKLVKASDYNLPQHRPRLYLIGFRKDVDDSFFSFAEPVPLTNTLSKVLNGEVTNLDGSPKNVGFTLRVGGRNSGILDKRNWDSYMVDGVPHSLTLDEAKKLQGFPDNYVFPVSATQAFKQLGNSVAVPAIHAQAVKIVETLNKHLT